MGQGVLGRYAPIKQMQGGVSQAMGAPDTGAVPNPAAVALREKMQGQAQQPRAANGTTGMMGALGPRLQSLVAQMRTRNPALTGR